MNKWFFVNFIIFCFVWIKITLNYHGVHFLFGGFAVSFILYNWTRHAMFSMIRSKKVPREKRITIAKIAKKALPFHKWTGSTALLIASFHMVLVVRLFGPLALTTKMVSGYITIILLILLAVFGWLRWYKTTVLRRYIHWTLAYLVIFSMIIHIILC